MLADLNFSDFEPIFPRTPFRKKKTAKIVAPKADITEFIFPTSHISLLFVIHNMA